MKRLFLSFFVAIMAMTVYAAKTIPSGDFETWTTDSVLYPENYPYNSILEKVPQFISNSVSTNVERVTDSYSNKYALKLTTKLVGKDTVEGYLVNVSPNNGSVSEWHGGFPYSETPTGLTGYYKYTFDSTDSAMIIVIFSKNGSNIGTYVKKLGGLHTTYTPFNLSFGTLSDTPDSVIVAFASSYTAASDENGPIGSALTIDSVAFTGVSSQPAELNGDFENWSDSTVNVLSNWYTQNGSENIKGIIRTTDAYAGKYALELKTFLKTSDNGSTKARPGYISTGYYEDNCNGNCTQQGGQPYTQQFDTLSFYYKYTPSGKDTAYVSVNLKTNGSFIGTYGMNKPLLSASSWTYVEIPIANVTVPDSAIINIQSSTSADTALSFVGSDLIIDNLQFKSQPLTSAIFNVKADKGVTLYPNPVSDDIQLTGISGKAIVWVTDMNGKNLIYKEINSTTETISLSALPTGVYLVYVKTADGIVQHKVIKK